MTPVPRADLPESPDEIGSRQVFEILALQNADMLMCFLRSVVPGSEVDDVFQDTLMTAWEKLPQFDRERPFGPWLRGIAMNKVKQLRGRRSRDKLRFDDEVMARIEGSFAAVPAQRRVGGMIELMLGCMDQLPDKLRLAIEFVYRRGFRIRRAADKLGASEEAIKKRVQRGRQLLAACVRNEGVQP